MQKVKVSEQCKYIGVDLHKKTCYITVMDKSGTITKQTEIENTPETVNEFFANYAKDKVAVESTLNWIPFYEKLEKLGCDVVLSNPLQTKAVASARIKNDKVDSEILADLLRTDFLPTAYIQPRNIRDLKELVRQRAEYVEIRTKMKNKIHSVLFKADVSYSFSSLYGKAGMEFLKNLSVRTVY